MISLRRIEHANELRMGMSILTVDLGGYECLEVIDCIDNGLIYTKGLHDNEYSVGELLGDYLESYSAIYEVVNL